MALVHRRVCSSPSKICSWQWALFTQETCPMQLKLLQKGDRLSSISKFQMILMKSLTCLLATTWVNTYDPKIIQLSFWLASQPRPLFVYFHSFQHIKFAEELQASVGFKLGSSKMVVSTMTTWPPRRHVNWVVLLNLFVVTSRPTLYLQNFSFCRFFTVTFELKIGVKISKDCDLDISALGTLR